MLLALHHPAWIRPVIGQISAFSFLLQCSIGEWNRLFYLALCSGVYCTEQEKSFILGSWIFFCR
jgi:hypothetical protein